MKPKSLPPFFLLCTLLLTACASTPDQVVNNDDPYEGINRKIYAFNDSLDRAFFQPLAKGYTSVTPSPVRKGVTNFFNNISELNVILHGLLQGKFKQGSADTMRFLLNSTAGLGGFFDVAKSAGLSAHDEDLGQTLATWGFAQGAYLNLPLFGPNTVRNTGNLASSNLTNPISYIGGLVLFPVYVLNAVNTRANLLDASELRDESALDPYAFTREAYLQQRKFLIFDGEPPLDVDLDSILEEQDDAPSMESGPLPKPRLEIQ